MIEKASKCTDVKIDKQVEKGKQIAVEKECMTSDERIKKYHRFHKMEGDLGFKDEKREKSVKEYNVEVNNRVERLLKTSGMGLLLMGGVMTSGVEGRLLMPELAGSAPSLKDSNNPMGLTSSSLTASDGLARFTSNGLPSRDVPPPLELLEKIKNPPWRFKQGDSQGTSGGETPQSATDNLSSSQKAQSRKMILGEETLSHQLGQDKSKKPEFVKSPRHLLNDEIFTRNLALVQEHPEKQGAHGRRLLWREYGYNGYTDGYDKGYADGYDEGYTDGRKSNQNSLLEPIVRFAVDASIISGLALLCRNIWRSLLNPSGNRPRRDLGERRIVHSRD